MSGQFAIEDVGSMGRGNSPPMDDPNAQLALPGQAFAPVPPPEKPKRIFKPDLLKQEAAAAAAYTALKSNAKTPEEHAAADAAFKEMMSAAKGVDPLTAAERAGHVVEKPTEEEKPAKAKSKREKKDD